MTTAFPLSWPLAWKRTAQPKYSSFKTPLGQAIGEILSELRMLKAQNVVISSNLPLSKQGFPLAIKSQPQDCGVAVYFLRDGRTQCIPCDKWKRIEDNMHAIGLTISALRGLDRWGAKEMVDAAFSGFQALPHYSTGSPVQTAQQYFNDCVDTEHAKQRWRNLSKTLHPDMGGKAEDFAEMNKQYDSFLKAKGGL